MIGHDPTINHPAGRRKGAPADLADPPRSAVFFCGTGRGSPQLGAGSASPEGSLDGLRAAGHRLSALHAPLTYLAETLGVLTVFGFGAWQITQDRISLGGLLSFAILVAYMYPQVQELAGWPLAASAATASAARVGEILDGAVPAMTAMRR
jgi:ABC-type multidrug transport system fused ATPase/permease subunit